MVFVAYPLSFSHYPKKYLEGRFGFGFAITEHWPSLNDRFTRLTSHLLETVVYCFILFLGEHFWRTSCGFRVSIFARAIKNVALVGGDRHTPMPK